MEVIQKYRQIIDKKTKELLIKTLKVTIKKSDLNKIGFIGYLGSVREEYSHDFDILIFPSENAKIGETIITISKFYDELEKELKKHNERFYLVISPKKSIQEMIYYLAGLQEGGAGLIPIHSLFFPDYKSFKKFNPKNFQKEIKKTLVPLYGEFNIIKKLRQNIPQNKLEPYFWILDFEMSSKLKNFPKHLIRTSAESLFNYLSSKYKLKCNLKKIHGIKEIEKELHRILIELDKKIYC